MVDNNTRRVQILERALSDHEIPFSKYQKFVFGDGDLLDHFELVIDEKNLIETQSYV